MSLEQQHAILDKTYKQITDFCGKPPRGSVAPWWEASEEGAELMLKYGIEYGMSKHTCSLVRFPKRYINLIRPPIRTQFLPPRLPIVLVANRRQVDQNRLQRESGRMDETTRERAYDRTRRDPSELVPRRPPTYGP